MVSAVACTGFYRRVTSLLGRDARLLAGAPCRFRDLAQELALLANGFDAPRDAGRGLPALPPPIA